MIKKQNKNEQLFYLQASKTQIKTRWGLVLFTLIASFLTSSTSAITLDIESVFGICLLWAIGNIALTFHTMCLERYAYLRFGSKSIKRLLFSWKKRDIRGNYLDKLTLIYLNTLSSLSELFDSILSIRKLGHLQIFLDLICFLSIIHFSGGIESPFAWLMVIPMVSGAITLPLKDSLYQLAFGFTALTSLFLAEHFQIFNKPKFINPIYGDLWQATPIMTYQLMTFIVLASCMFLAIYKLRSFYKSRFSDFTSTVDMMESNTDRFRYALEETEVSVLVINENLTILETPIISSSSMFQKDFVGHSLLDLFTGIEGDSLKQDLFLLSLSGGTRSLKINYLEEGEKSVVYDLAFYLKEEGSKGQRKMDLIIRDHSELISVKTLLASENLRAHGLEQDIEYHKEMYVKSRERAEEQMKEILTIQKEKEEQQTRNSELLEKVKQDNHQQMVTLMDDKKKEVNQALQDANEALAKQLTYFTNEQEKLRQKLKEESHQLSLGHRIEKIEMEKKHQNKLSSLKVDFRKRYSHQEERFEKQQKEALVEKESEMFEKAKHRMAEHFKNRISHAENEIARLQENSKTLEKRYADEKKRVDDYKSEKIRFDSLSKQSKERVELLNKKIARYKARLENIRQGHSKVLTGIATKLGIENSGKDSAELTTLVTRRITAINRENDSANELLEIRDRECNSLKSFKNFHTEIMKTKRESLDSFLQHLSSLLKKYFSLKSAEIIIFNNEGREKSPVTRNQIIEEFLADQKVKLILLEKGKSLQWGDRKEWNLVPVEILQHKVIMGFRYENSYNANLGEQLAKSVGGYLSHHLELATRLKDLNQTIENKNSFEKDILTLKRPQCDLNSGIINFSRRWNLDELNVIHRDLNGQVIKYGNSSLRVDSLRALKKSIIENDQGNGACSLLSQQKSDSNSRLYTHIYRNKVKVVTLVRIPVEVHLSSSQIELLLTTLAVRVENESLMALESTWASVVNC